MTKTILNPSIPYHTLSVASTLTTNAYVTLGTMWTKDSTKTTIALEEDGTNDCQYSIDVQMKDLSWHNKKTDQDISDKVVYETLTDPWYRIRVQIKSKVGGAHGNVALESLSEKMSA